MTLTRQIKQLEDSLVSGAGRRLHLGAASEPSRAAGTHHAVGVESREKDGRRVKQCSECVRNPIPLKHTPTRTNRIGCSFNSCLLFSYSAHSSPQEARSRGGTTTFFKYSSLFVVFFFSFLLTKAQLRPRTKLQPKQLCHSFFI